MALGVTILWSVVATEVIMLLVKATIGVRVDQEAEDRGLDLSEHGESAYDEF
jgi:Amt family ammonium transporter